jgi:hypothetical protein
MHTFFESIHTDNTVSDVSEDSVGKKKLSTSFHFPGAIPQTCRSTHPVGAIAVQCLVVMIMELVSLDMSEECRGYVSPLHCFTACALNYFISVGGSYQVLTGFL